MSVWRSTFMFNAVRLIRCRSFLNKHCQMNQQQDSGQ